MKNELISKVKPNLLRLNLQHFAEPGDEPSQEPVDNPTQDEPQADNPTEPKTVTMTQEELNALIVKEKGRVKAKYAEFDKFKKIADDYEAEKAELERQKLTETERLQADLEAAQQEREQYASKLEAVEKAAEQQRIQTAFVRKAQEKGVKYTDAAIKLSDLSALKFGEDGELEGIDDVLNALITENPFLMAPEHNKPKSIGGGSDAGEEKQVSKKQQLKDAEDRARASGRMEDRVAVAKLKRELGL